MDLEGVEASVGGGTLLALSPGALTHPHLTLGGGEVVTLQEGGPGESLLLCPVEEEGAGGEGAIAYATLEGGEEFVVQAGGVVGPGWKAGGGEGQLVVVGEAGEVEPITYIYIKGEGEGDKDGVEGHTITLNAADGSALHTLPASYTSHPYGDLVLVGAPAAQEDQGLGAITAAGETVDGGERVLLLSVGHLKVEEEGSPAPPSQPDPAQEGNTSVASVKVLPGRHQQQQQQQQQQVEEEEEEEEEEEGKDQVEVVEEEEGGDGGSTFEARLATRDSLLPPRRVRRSAPPGNLSCPACEAAFKSSRQYHSHLQSHRGPSAWHCPACSHPCDSPSALRTHRATVHRAARPYACPTCPLAFPKSLVLEDHIRSVHNKERPFPCSLCPKAFYRPYDLKMHLNLHLGIKTKVCDVCGRQFSHSSNLIRHQCLHTGVKPYVCNTCGKRFKQVTLLHKHHMVHQEGSCPLCPAPVPIPTPTALCRHYRLDHKKTITLKEASRVLRGQRGPALRCFYCRVCGAQFSVKAKLTAHEEEAHPGDGHHHCVSCKGVFPMSEVKTHACLSPDEHRKVNTLLHLRARPASAKATTATATAPEPELAAQDTPTTTLVLPDEPLALGDGEEEEEEYLVMYITPEGESLSYVMKKGNRPWQEQVLQVDAPRDTLGAEDLLPRPEDTIMINVHHQDHDNTLLLAPPDPPPPPPASPDPLQDTIPPLPLHSIKLEPQGCEDDTLESLAAPDKPLLPLATPKTEVETHTSLKAVAIKAEKTYEEEEAVTENKTEATTTAAPAAKKQGGDRQTGAKKGHLVCVDCGKTFSKQWNFQQHLATHNASLHRYKCDQCGLTFAYRSTLNKHMDHHNPEPQIHQCQQCPKTYKCLASLKQHHKRDHERRRPYACELCHKDFFSKSDYKYHMRAANGTGTGHCGQSSQAVRRHTSMPPTNTITPDTFHATTNLTLKLAMATEATDTLDEATLLPKDAGEDLLGIHSEGITLGPDATLPSTMIMEGDQGGEEFPGVEARMVGGMDGECIAIFVGEDLS
ncbi:Zinc finger protein 582 [Chionoecetes opilio]|uniref:Zinc finger protein 582 n=1 Tax=Chionoecetes opilio TaxID=41210 RepID=A0A8J4YFI1_CHIOP|nr:Zinc finger protein 582 [Chionoecetes opilio]